MDDQIKLVLGYIGLSLACKNFANDRKLYEKSELHGKRIYIARTEAAIKLIKQDQEQMRRTNRLSVKVIHTTEDSREYQWRTRFGSGTFRLSAQQLLRLTAKASHRYWVDKNIEFELKPFY
ncbi:hypothetical protein [Terribacillus saccharophilus]|uniref:hypothetical protein n=1 Tax=Terribacillus saccharophilus TaxID=361277 RepID=UPI002DD3865B|nr:hypothetical protein [Terribacillus saccharophilus]MEC0288934.1 hypothetical protein [Terribacillus saccharophilus]